MSKQLVILGDSHTRSFSFRKNIIPVFLGRGWDINLHKYANILKQSRLAKEKIKFDNKIFFLYVGEPDIRYQLNKDWHVHTSGFKYKGKVDYKHLDNCISNYQKLLTELDFISYILTPTTAYNPSLDGLKYFNTKLKETFGSMVIDITSKTLGNEGVKEIYKGSDYDPIHLNSNIADVLAEKLVLNKVYDNISIEDFTKDKEGTFNSKDYQKLYFNNRFGTFKIE